MIIVSSHLWIVSALQTPASLGPQALNSPGIRNIGYIDGVSSKGLQSQCLIPLLANKWPLLPVTEFGLSWF